ncbi:hypothetical protein MXB_92, partial [Myxobolus squamalis]
MSRKAIELRKYTIVDKIVANMKGPKYIMRNVFPERKRMKFFSKYVKEASPKHRAGLVRTQVIKFCDFQKTYYQTVFDFFDLKPNLLQ